MKGISLYDRSTCLNRKMSHVAISVVNPESEWIQIQVGQSIRIGIFDPSETESRKAKMAKYRNKSGSNLESGFGFPKPGKLKYHPRKKKGNS
jgi:hypothetical protein